MAQHTIEEEGGEAHRRSQISDIRYQMSDVRCQMSDASGMATEHRE
jgi:hypothetical protein